MGARRLAIPVAVVACWAAIALAVDDPARAQVPPNELISVDGATPIGEGPNLAPSISGDGTRVTFLDQPEYGPDTAWQRDRIAPLSSAISTVAGAPPPAISRDGCHVAYTGDDEVRLRRLCAPTSDVAVSNTNGPPDALSISSNGRYVAWSTSGYVSVGENLEFHRFMFVRDMALGQTVTLPGVGNRMPMLSDEDAPEVVLGFLRQDPVPDGGSRGNVVRWRIGEDLGTDPETFEIVSNEPGEALESQDETMVDALSMSGNGRSFAYRYQEYDCDPPVQLVATDPEPTLRFAPRRAAAGELGCDLQLDQRRVRSLDRPVPQPFPDGLADFEIGTTDESPTGWSQDGRQVAYSRRVASCMQCRELAVARSTAGFFTGVAIDAVPLDPAFVTPDAFGRLRDPVLSSTGRVIAFSARPGRAADEAGELDGQHVYVRTRLPAPSLTPIDFGGVTVGETSPAQASILTNSGLTDFFVDRLETTGDFALAGDDCPPTLAPGDACSVSVTFTPSAPGERLGVVTAAEELASLLQPRRARAQLRGEGIPPATTTTTTTTTTVPDTTTTTTTTTTTVPNSTTTTTARPTTTTSSTTTTTTSTTTTSTTSTTTTTTVPPTDGLTITPTAAGYPVTVVGGTTAPIAFSVRNTGTRTNTVGAAVLGGADVAQFAIIDDDCAGQALAAGAACVVSVAFAPTADGSAAATVRVAGERGTSATATLTGVATVTPALVMSPAVVRGGGVTTAIGQGFPPEVPLTLTFEGRDELFTVTTDGAGGFRMPIVVRSGAPLGTHLVSVEAQPDRFDVITAPVLIVLASYQPQSASGPAFGLDVLLSRG